MQRVIQVLVDSENRKPIQILDVTGSFWTFDEAGKVDVSLRRTAGEWMNFAFSAHRNDSSGTLVDLVPEMKRKELHARHRWTVSQEILDRIAADIWTGINGPAPDVLCGQGESSSEAADDLGRPASLGRDWDEGHEHRL